VEVEYVFQTVPAHRKKPYGTGDAVLCAAEAVDTPFAVINADDFYGADAFRQIYRGLQNKNEYCMVGYRLANTLSENGSVSRGVCRIENGFLEDVTEHTAITRDTDLDPETVVSMNMWGMQPDLFPELKAQFAEFLTTADITKDEFFIPRVIDRMIKEGKKQVRVYPTSEVWYGMTYREDKEKVAAAIAQMTEQGQYPGKLWS
jgi:NDP-sugar pyrophosphorylase family protein